MDKIVVNSILIARRKEKKLNQGQISKLLGLNQRTYQRKEQGCVSFEDLNRILEVLDLKMVIISKEQIS